MKREDKDQLTREWIFYQQGKQVLIRKFTVGTASILVGATLMFGAADNEAKAAEDNQLESASKEEQKGSRDNENSKLNQVDLDNGSHSSEKTTNVNNATEVKS